MGRDSSDPCSRAGAPKKKGKPQALRCQLLVRRIDFSTRMMGTTFEKFEESNVDLLRWWKDKASCFPKLS